MTYPACKSIDTELGDVRRRDDTSQTKGPDEMSEPHKVHLAAEAILDRLNRLMSTVAVFGDPIEHNGFTVIPAARVTAGGGGGRGIDQGADREGDGGGAGLLARPAGAFIIKDGRVAWKPAISIRTASILAVLAVLYLARQK
jgi:uncharacterized spore protein YtfJ